MKMITQQQKTELTMSESQDSVKRGASVIKHPRVSVITPCYNSADYIVETVESVRRQSFADIEHIVVNDGSSDTDELIANLGPYLDEIVFVDRENGGAGAARNSGISVACGEFIGFVDADDIW